MSFDIFSSSIIPINLLFSFSNDENRLETSSKDCFITFSFYTFRFLTGTQILSLMLH